MQHPKQVVTEQQVGFIASSERGELVTIVFIRLVGKGMLSLHCLSSRKSTTKIISSEEYHRAQPIRLDKWRYRSGVFTTYHQKHKTHQTVSKRTGKCGSFSIREMQHKHGEAVRRQLPDVHAIGGCDTTSEIYGIGKGSTVKAVRFQWPHSTYRHSARQSAALVDVLCFEQKMMLATYGLNTGTVGIHQGSG